MSKLQETIEKAKQQLENSSTEDKKEDLLETVKTEPVKEIQPTKEQQGELDKLTKTLGTPIIEEPAQTDNDFPAEPFSQPARVIEAYNAPKGSYKAIRLAQVIRGSGEKVKPNKFGYYVDADEETTKLLKYYAKTGLVEKV